MSVLKFTLTKEHIKLARHIDLEDISSLLLGVTPNLDNLIEVAGVILYGRPEKFDPLNEDPFNWTEEQLIETQKLLMEVPTAIDIILNTKSFKPGQYKTKYHDRNWKLID